MVKKLPSFEIIHAIDSLLQHKTKARFKRRTLHVPNLIIRFGTCKVRRLNQLGSADLYLGRPAVLFGRACRIERQKIDFDSYVDLHMYRT